jgi:hypothetical protein
LATARHVGGGRFRRYPARLRGITGLGAFAALALAGLFGLVSPPARADLLPPSLVGVWAEGDCATAQRVRLVSALAVMDFLPVNGATNVQVLLLDKVQPPAQDVVAVSLTSPNIHARLDHGFALDGDRLDGRFVRCPDASPALRWQFGEAISAFQGFGEIAAACAEDSGPRCLAKAFAFADVTGDGRLSPAEIARLLRALTFFVVYLANDKTIVPTSEMVASSAVAALVTPLLVNSIMTTFDYNGDGAVSLDELLQDRGAAGGAMAAVSALQPVAMQAALQGLVTTVAPILQLLPNLLPR